MPSPFWVVTSLLCLGGLRAAGNTRTGLGLPMLAVIGTVAVWYVGDALYNDYPNTHAWFFTRSILRDAWWQVALFLVTFLFVTPHASGVINNNVFARRSRVDRIVRSGKMPAGMESGLHKLFHVCWIGWTILALIAVIRFQENAVYYFFPFLGGKLDPWGRPQIGGGISALLSAAAVTQSFIAASLGVVAALVRHRGVRMAALALCAVIWPYYIFDRTRNSILVVVVPAVLAWVFLRLRASMLVRLVVLGVCFLALEGWFKVIIANREGMRIDLHSADILRDATKAEVRHTGLNMFEELCWINTLINDGTCTLAYGQEYLAQLVNPVPRGLWPDKPAIGLDYAIARGQEYTEGGTTATISRGIIGQGVANFGRCFGPIFAALLTSLWTCLLARLDLQGHRPGRLILYALGLVLTFNLGRDITFLTLYPFAFGWVIVTLVERSGGPKPRPEARRPKPAPDAAVIERKKSQTA
ncbi:MAG TPA: hypothetical protein VJA21_17805 [Verrucomicrobiae bacterium]